MTDRLNQELNALLVELHVEVEESAHPPERITLVRLSHRADRQEWQRVAQHLDALGREINRRPTCELTQTSFEGNPAGPRHAFQVDQVLLACAAADIIVIGWSVDMQLLLQAHEQLEALLLTKLGESEPGQSLGRGTLPARRSRQEPPPLDN